MFRTVTLPGPLPSRQRGQQGPQHRGGQQCRVKTPRRMKLGLQLNAQQPLGYGRAEIQTLHGHRVERGACNPGCPGPCKRNHQPHDHCCKGSPGRCARRTAFSPPQQPAAQQEQRPQQPAPGAAQARGRAHVAQGAGVDTPKIGHPQPRAGQRPGQGGLHGHTKHQHAEQGAQIAAASQDQQAGRAGAGEHHPHTEQAGTDQHAGETGWRADQARLGGLQHARRHQSLDTETGTAHCQQPKRCAVAQPALPTLQQRRTGAKRTALCCGPEQQTRQGPADQQQAACAEAVHPSVQIHRVTPSGQSQTLRVGLGPVQSRYCAAARRASGARCLLPSLKSVCPQPEARRPKPAHSPGP